MIIPIIVILVIIAVVILGFFFKVLKQVLRTLIFIGIGACMLIFIAGLLVYLDASSFKKEFPENPKKMLLLEEDRFIAGMSAVDFSDPSYFSDSELDTLSTIYSSQNYSGLVGEEYKAILFEISAFDSVDTIKVPGITVLLSRDDYLKVLRSEQASESLSTILYNTLNLSVKNQIDKQEFISSTSERLGNDEQVKANIFMVLVSKAGGQNQAKFLVDGVRNGKISVYPESYLFKLVKYVPEGMLASALEG